MIRRPLGYGGAGILLLTIFIVAVVGCLVFILTGPPRQHDHSSWVRQNREVIELTNVPNDVRCFALIGPGGYVSAALSCFPRVTK